VVAAVLLQPEQAAQQPEMVEMERHQQFLDHL